MSNWKWQHGLMALLMVLVAISTSFILTILYSPLIYAGFSGVFPFYQTLKLDYGLVLHNYMELYRYLINPFQQVLAFPNFISSAQGLQHFAEVKGLMWGLAIVCVMSWGGLFHVKHRGTSFTKLWLKHYIKQIQYVLIGIAGLTVLFFEQAFLLFHQLLFRNDLWLFNPTTDPIILVLPLELFQLFFVVIAVSYFVLIRWISRLVER